MGRDSNPGHDEDCPSEPENIIGEINEMDWTNQHKCVPDARACDQVGQPSTLPHLPIQETVASRGGLYYQAANGTKMPNVGCNETSAISDLGDAIDLRMQVGEGTKRILGSVMQDAD